MLEDTEGKVSRKMANTVLECIHTAESNGYADNMMVDGIAYRIKHATILAIGIEPDGKIQGLHSIGNYATMQTLPRHKAKVSKVKPLHLTGL